MIEERRPWRGVYGLVILIPALLLVLQALYFDHVNRSDAGLGLPIDDAYIFQRYAENIEAGAGFSFNPHETSFGGTSLIWPVILALLFSFLQGASHISIAFWTGAVLAAAAAGGAAALARRRTGSASFGLLAGVLTAASPLFFMNAVSGMETGLTMALLTVLAALALSSKPRPFSAGLTAGIITLNRPEGVYFPIGMALAWLISAVLARKRPSPVPVLVFIGGWAILAAPAGLVFHHYIGSYLPNTYLGKIISSVPGALSRGYLERAVWGVLSLADGWKRLAWPLHALAPVMAVGLLFILVSCARELRRHDGEAWPRLGTILLAGYLFLPFAYGFSFPIHPAFGGYYNRYIAPVHPVWMILATLGLHSLYAEASARYRVLNTHSRSIVPALIVLALVYQGHLWSFQAREEKDVFIREVKLNTGLRMEAAKWIAANTPADAKVMVGYTGLGVVGGNCNRYVLDLGALINPDIFASYRDAPMDPKGRWKSMVAYMHDRGITYYVTFAFTREYADKIADPGATPGFIEVARLGSQGEPRSPYEQIRIYRIDWPRWEAEATLKILR